MLIFSFTFMNNERWNLFWELLLLYIKAPIHYHLIIFLCLDFLLPKKLFKNIFQVISKLSMFCVACFVSFFNFVRNFSFSALWSWNVTHTISSFWNLLNWGWVYTHFLSITWEKEYFLFPFGYFIMKNWKYSQK